jgi:hypothetical protein
MYGSFLMNFILHITLVHIGPRGIILDGQIVTLELIQLNSFQIQNKCQELIPANTCT